MKKTITQIILGIAVVLCLCALPLQAQAKPTKAKVNKVEEIEKERLVLMPLRLSEEDQKLQGAMETALIEGLRKKYEVFSGEQVAKKAREIFNKESRNTAHKECDETRCLQDIAEAFQAELLAVANITKDNGGYFIALSIRNLYDNKDVDSKSVACKGCDAYAVVDKLKELVGDAAPVAATPAPVSEAPQVKVNQNDPDEVLWAEAQKGNTVEDYQVYLDTYPIGKYAPFAKAQSKKLQEAAQAVAEQQEQSAWDAAQQENNEGSYRLYLKSYPTGKFAGFVKVRIDKIQREAASSEANQRREQAAAEANQRREAGNGPAMIRIPGKNYEMGKFYVTQKEWRDVMGSNPSGFSSCGDTCPVEKVSWNDVHEFIQKLNAKTGKQYRLPIEEEWEYACYGGSQTEYCGGSNLDSVAWYDKNSNERTHPVGQKQANSYGLYDMSGNVWQWMENQYDKGHDWRALRGGSWYDSADILRASLRVSNAPANRSSSIGIRLARTLP